MAGQYSLKQPTLFPLKLANVKVHDIEIDSLTQSDPQDDDLLNLQISLEVNASSSTVAEDGKVKDDIVSDWWKSAQKQLEKADENELTEGWLKIQEQVYLIHLFG